MMAVRANIDGTSSICSQLGNLSLFIGYPLHQKEHRSNGAIKADVPATSMKGQSVTKEGGNEDSGLFLHGRRDHDLPLPVSGPLAGGSSCTAASIVSVGSRMASLSAEDSGRPTRNLGRWNEPTAENPPRQIR
jgi:hypothetical protein